MPTYQYACTECHDQFEIVQKFTDDALTECPHCSGRLRKVFSAVGVVFKGSGFYRTDSRSGGSATVAAAGGSESSSSESGPGSGSGSGAGSDSKSGSDSTSGSKSTTKSDSGSSSSSASKSAAPPSP